MPAVIGDISYPRRLRRCSLQQLEERVSVGPVDKLLFFLSRLFRCRLLIAFQDFVMRVLCLRSPLQGLRLAKRDFFPWVG